MDKQKLKKVLKPLIKECVKEAIFEDGVLSGLISEVVRGLEGQRIVTEGVTITKSAGPDPEEQRRREEEYERKRQEKIKRLNESASVGGVNIFEGTKPLPGNSPAGSPMAGTSPSDPGVDLADLLGGASKKWKHLI